MIFTNILIIYFSSSLSWSIALPPHSPIKIPSADLQEEVSVQAPGWTAQLPRS